MLSETIKKCPFCGGSAWVDCNEGGNEWWVECKECAARSPMAKVDKHPTFKTAGEAYSYAIGAWERRVEEDAE